MAYGLVVEMHASEWVFFLQEILCESWLHQKMHNNLPVRSKSYKICSSVDFLQKQNVSNTTDNVEVYFVQVLMINGINSKSHKERYFAVENIYQPLVFRSNSKCNWLGYLGLQQYTIPNKQHKQPANVGANFLLRSRLDRRNIAHI